MYKTIVCSLLFCLAFTNANAQKKRLPVQVVSATSQTWVSGAPGGRTGTNYVIKVYVNTDKDVKFQNLWLGQQNVPFSVEFTNTEIPKKIMQGDTLLLVANVVNNEPSEKLLPERPPVKYKGGAIFETLVGGKHRYFIVSRFKQLASLRGE